jgi:undecaprenyl-diphosphatase
MQMPFYEEQLRFMTDMAQHRTPFFDLIFRGLNYVDTRYFAIALISLIWIGFSYRWGIRINYLLYLSYVLNAFMKDIFGWSRPPADLALYYHQSYGFPSGGAQNAMLLGCLVIYYWNNKYAWVTGGAWILLLSYTRIYIGVHYPIDILGGWILGLAIFYIFMKSIDPIEKHLKSKGLLYAWIAGTALPLLLFRFHSFDMMVLPLGICLSLYYHLYLSPPKTLWHGLVRAAIALIGVVLLFFLSPSRPICAMSIALWISLAASPLIHMVYPKNKS